MSVVESKRAPRKFRVLSVATDNCKRTILLCKSEKNFPKRNRWLLTNAIVQASNNALKYCIMANNIAVRDYEDYILRRQYQMQAKGCAFEQLTMMQIAYETLNPDLSMDAWVGGVDELLTLLSSWMDSDRNRYHDIIEQHNCLSEMKIG